MSSSLFWGLNTNNSTVKVTSTTEHIPGHGMRRALGMASTATRAAATHQGQLLAQLSDHTDLPVNGHTVPSTAHNSSSVRSYISINTWQEQSTQQIMICKYKEAKLEAICMMLFPGADVSVSERGLIVWTVAVVLRKCSSKKSINKFHQDTTEIWHFHFARVRSMYQNQKESFPKANICSGPKRKMSNE